MEAGYACSHFGKWHLGDIEGRLPSDRGFAEWYGIPRTMNESMFTNSPYFEESGLENPYILEGQAGSPSEKVKIPTPCALPFLTSPS